MNQIVFPNKFIDQTGFYANEKLSLDFFANYDRMKNDFDGTFDNFNNPDTLNVSTSEQFRLGFSKYKYEKESLC
jgi:vitamin B12 transporter